MGYEVELIQFSQNPDGNKLATFLINLARSAQTELARHRMLSLSFSSSRAVPTRIMIKNLLEDTYYPKWTKNTAGMAGKFSDESDSTFYNDEWKLGLYETLTTVVRMMTKTRFRYHEIYDMSLEELVQLLEQHKDAPHKQDINRLLEPYMFMPGIVSGTEWSNFFFQRVDENAYHPLQEVAYKMAKLYFTTEPQKLEWGEWHLPLVTQKDIEELDDYCWYKAGECIKNHMDLAAKLSTSRCGRISFLKQDKKDIDEDLKWYQKHIYDNAANGKPQHCSPAEHPAQAMTGKHANYTGFKSLRSTIPGENHTSFTLEDLNKYEERTGREITK